MLRYKEDGDSSESEDEKNKFIVKIRFGNDNDSSIPMSASKRSYSQLDDMEDSRDLQPKSNKR